MLFNKSLHVKTYNMEKISLTRCPICGVEYEKSLNTCPNCGYKQPINFTKTLWIFIAIILPLTIFHFVDFSKFTVKTSETPSKEELIKEEISIPIREMTELSYLSKDEILKKRIEYVNNSKVFKTENYKPREDVYQIEDNLPWISAYEIALNGTKGNKNIGEGASRCSVSINNPELLMSFIVPEFQRKNARESFSEADYFLPEKLLWDEKNKTLKAHFNIKSFYDKNPDYMGMAMYTDETNARDLGYNWIFCDKSKNIQFVNEFNNISVEPYEMKGYYHKGFSCGLENGCNNYSPYQEEMPFRLIDNTGYLKLKMWKEKPKNKFQAPDIIYEMYL